MADFPDRNPVVLIHGIDDTGLLFDRLGRSLRDQGWDVHTFNLVPNNGQVGLDKLAEQIAGYVEKTFDREQMIDLVGFSMGGLVARYYVQRLATPRRAQRLITISTPHLGTWAAFLRWNTGARQMRKNRNGLQRSNCAQCGKTYTEEQVNPLGDIRIDMEKAVLALKLLIEGSSIRTTERISGLHRDTICRLLLFVGEKCEKLLTEKIQDVRVKDVELTSYGPTLARRKATRSTRKRTTTCSVTPILSLAWNATLS